MHVALEVLQAVGVLARFVDVEQVLVLDREAVLSAAGWCALAKRQQSFVEDGALDGLLVTLVKVVKKLSAELVVFFVA